MKSIYLRLSICDECNLRCTYCRPAREHRLAVGRPGLDTDSLLRLVGWLDAEVELRKLRLTGGEPLLRPDVVEVVAALRQRLPRTELCLTTNGTRLVELAAGLRSAGLDRINVSLDTVDAEVYTALTRGGRLAAVLDGLAAARTAGFAPLKVNAVLLRSLAGAALERLVRWAAREAVELRFIELMPISVAAGMHRTEFLASSEVLAGLEQRFGRSELLAASATAQRHRLRVDGRELVVGFISSVSEPFCDRCDRLRLDSRGKLFACLRHPDWLDLAAPLRRGDEAEVRQRLARVLAHKCAPECIWPGRQMSAIGG